MVLPLANGCEALHSNHFNEANSSLTNLINPLSISDFYFKYPHSRITWFLINLTGIFRCILFAHLITGRTVDNMASRYIPNRCCAHAHCINARLFWVLTPHSWWLVINFSEVIIYLNWYGSYWSLICLCNFFTS